MGANFVNIDRESPMLLPPDLKDWVEGNDLVHFILEVVEGCDTSCAATNHRGTGSAQYPPAMMLSLLVYCYATGCFSSRQIERATYDSVAVRYLCGNTHPDHDTIASFRRRNKALLEHCFFQVLALAREIGLLKMGTLSVDGTKIKGSARQGGQKTLAQIDAELEALEKQTSELLKKAEQYEKEEQDQSGLNLPGELSCTEARKKKLIKARQCLEGRLQRLKENRKKSRERYQLPSSERKRPGKKPDPKVEKRRVEEEEAKQKISLSDPESHRLPHRKEGFIQGYNAQASVCVGTRIIASTQLGNSPNDSQQLEPTLSYLDEKERQNIKEILADKGYWDGLKLPQLEKNLECIILCPPKQSKATLSKPYPKHHPRKKMDRFKRKMKRRLKTRQGQELYKKRSSTSEGPFNVIKNIMGFKEFRLRGLEGAQIEWNLVTLAYNCRKLAKI